MAREMKNSGVKWIGEIPKEWVMTKYKSVGSVLSGFPFNSENFTQDTGFPLIRIRDITSGCAGTFYSGSYPNNYIIHNGDFLLGMDGDFNVRWWNGGDALLNQRCCRLKFNENLYAKYIYYLIPYGLKLINDLAYSTTVKHLSVPDILNLNILTPPLSEQKAIADFLDKKCAEIDGLLADLEAEIKILAEYKKSIISEVTTQGLNKNVKKKQSGIDWVGNIPAHWQVVPFRSYVVERTEKNLGGRNKNLLALSFALGVTRYADKKYNMDRVKDDFCGYQIVHEKDLVLSPNDIIKGSIFVSEYKGCISPMYRVFSNYDPETYNLYYLSYHLRTKESGRKFFYIARGLIGEILDNGKYVTRRMSVSQQDLLKFKVLLPPIEEQNEIVRYLDEKCVFIEQAIADKQTQIETLKAYKSSLIYEYVTGKKQVI